MIGCWSWSDDSRVNMKPQGRRTALFKLVSTILAVSCVVAFISIYARRPAIAFQTFESQLADIGQKTGTRMIAKVTQALDESELPVASRIKLLLHDSLSPRSHLTLGFPRRKEAFTIESATSSFKMTALVVDDEVCAVNIADAKESEAAKSWSIELRQLYPGLRIRTDKTNAHSAAANLSTQPRQ
jgi:hypothetical protein